MKKIYALGILFLVTTLMIGAIVEARMPFAGRLVKIKNGEQRGNGNPCFAVDSSQFSASKQFILWNQDPASGQQFEFVYGLAGLDTNGQQLFVGIHCSKTPNPGLGNPHFVPIASVVGTDFSAEGFSGIWTPATASGGLNFVATVTGTGANGHPTWTADITELLGGSGKSYWW